MRSDNGHNQSIKNNAYSANYIYIKVILLDQRKECNIKRNLVSLLMIAKLYILIC